MSCQTKANQVCQASTFSGIPRRAGQFAFVAGLLGTATGLATAVNPTMRGFYVISAFLTAINAWQTFDTVQKLQARKKQVTKHVVMDRKGNEIGWAYDPAVAKAVAKKEAGAKVVPIGEKVDYEDLQKFLRSKKDFQQVRKDSTKNV